MNNKSQWLQKKERVHGVLLALGLLLLAGGLAVRRFGTAPVIPPNLIEGFGLGIAFYAAFSWLRYRSAARRDSQSLRRELAAEQDERSRLIRGLAGRNAYLVSAGLSFLVLYLYSYFTSSQGGFDLLWFGLAGLFIIPGLVYMASLLWLENKN